MNEDWGVEKWVNNGWRRTGGEKVENRMEFESLLEEMEYVRHVKFVSTTC